MSDAPTFRPAPSVAAARISGATTVLLHVPNQTYYRLNATGGALWALLEERGEATADELVRSLCREHEDVERSTVRGDVQAFLDDLAAADLLFTV